MKILIISLAGVGDTLFAIPLIHAIRKSLPKSGIEVLVMWESSAAVLRNNPDIDRIHQYDMFGGGLLGTLAFCAKLRKRGYDISINTCPQSNYRYHLVSYLIHAGRRLGHDYGDRSGGALFTERVPLDYRLHLIDNNMNFLRLLGIRSSMAAKDRKPKIYLLARNSNFAEGFLRRNKLAGRKLVGIHVGSGRTKNLILRRWPAENYKDLIEMILSRHPNVSVLLFGRDDERIETNTIKEEVDNGNLLVVESADILDSCALVGKLDAFISVDTAFMNIAAAMEVPLQVVINTPTINRTVLPRRPNLIVVGKAPPKSVFYRYDGQGIHGGADAIEAYMESISPAEVYDSLRRRI